MSDSQQPVKDIQSTDAEQVEDTITDLQQQYRRRQRHTERAEQDARLRKILDQARKALADAADHDLESLLHAAHWIVRDHEDIETVLRPDYDGLEPQVKSRFREQIALRDQGETPDSAVKELETLFHIALELELVYGVNDMTWYEPVRFSKIDPAPGKASTSGEVTPVGRIRVGADEPIGPGDRRPIIEHKSCEHVLTVALPRQGKDSTNVSLCANLKEEHQYKWISLWDDGRDETNMIATPNDEQPIQEGLEELNQEPTAYDTNVYVPAMSGLPSELPGNFEPFTIGVDDLTGKLILQLGGFSADRNTISRVEQALSEAKTAKSDEVAVLVDRLEKYAEEVEATVTIRHLADDEMTSDDLDDGEELVHDDGGATEIRYEMDADDVLRECAQTVLHLAGEGLLADSDAETNLDMTEIVKRKDRVATLNCNYLEDRNEPLKYIITNLWLRLLLRVRDKDKSLPRVALEVRELKQIAPSKMTIVDYASEVRPLRQTLYEIATQGGSRRILMLGSTQKLNDVAKPVRSNMPYKVFLKLDNGLIKTMNDEMDFPYDLCQQLKGFEQGQGALKVDEDFFWPIWWRGAPCGLGDGDVPFERRYGLAYGFRVRSHEDDRWSAEYADENDWWADSDGTACSSDEPPAVDEWYLLESDFEDCVRPETLDAESVKRFAERRQTYDVPNDLTFQRTSIANESREMRLERLGQAKEREMAEMMNGQTVPIKTDGGMTEEYRPPETLRKWLEYSTERRQKLLHSLSEVERGEITNRKSLSHHTGIPEGTIAEYLADSELLGACVEKKSGVYSLTSMGEKAIGIQWSEL
ncbi:hypothetical protein [Natronorubrum texcoconense]|uniref:Uncharacterized protein n=1 Tax=Natronorubrum texcoconense TaxID=1095776 RepID=A0A1G9H8F5_9EURY|nr:hypothetical protein [Natronorubrum texcoconense]SDL09236.1 hypothetical protein SAMN04515672_0146 [Natronorubrum texcoconense]